MSPTEFTVIRSRLKLEGSDCQQRRQLGIILGLNSKQPEDTIRHWETCTNPIPGPVALCMKFMDRHGLFEE